jgi:aspartate 1-decarboxylase
LSPQAQLQKETISLGKNMVWATIDEIIYRKTINGFNINDDVIDLFNKQKYFKTIFSLENRSFPNPFQLYLCKNDKEMASNEPNETLVLSNVLVGEPILPFEHPLLGYGYFFTSEPLANTSNINNLQRFSCFIVNCFYAFNLSKESLKITFNEEPSTKTSNDDISIVLSSLHPSDTSLTNEKEDINGVHESNEILENIMAASSVYFNENGVQYWFIKNISHFTKI